MLYPCFIHVCYTHFHTYLVFIWRRGSQPNTSVCVCVCVCIIYLLLLIKIKIIIIIIFIIIFQL